MHKPDKELFYNFFEEIPAEPAEEKPAEEPAAEPKPEGEEPKVEPEAGDDGGEGEPNKPEAKKDPSDQPVPFQRFQKTNNELKAAREELERLKAEKPKVEDKSGSDDEPELDENSQKAVDKFMQKQGYVKKADLERQDRLRTAEVQVKQDVKELSSWAKTEGYPEFNAAKVNEWADENLGKDFVKNKASLKAAYLTMNETSIREMDRKGGLKPTGSSAERPGAAAKAAPPEDTEKKNFIGSSISAALDEIESSKA